MPDRSRIPPKPSEYSTYMQRTDNRQLSIDPATGNPRWMSWTWTADESAQWTRLRQRSEKLYRLYSNKNFKNTNAKDHMHNLVKETRSYDRSASAGHHLLNKVGLYGNIDDWNTFRIKQGTSLQKKASRNSGEAGMPMPVITLRKTDVGFHTLSAKNPETPKSRALPEGMQCVLVYRYVGLVPPKSVEQYVTAGVAKRGIFRSYLSELVLQPDKKYYAWYIARYLSKRGKIGRPCPPVQAAII